MFQEQMLTTAWVCVPFRAFNAFAVDKQGKRKWASQKLYTNINETMTENNKMLETNVVASPNLAK